MIKRGAAHALRHIDRVDSHFGRPGAGGLGAPGAGVVDQGILSAALDAGRKLEARSPGYTPDFIALGKSDGVTGELVLVKKVFPGQERMGAGVRGIPSPFINLDERGRDPAHPSPCPLLPRKDLFAGVLDLDFGL
jgi:hypothetical protein